jgi:hypothetical protein
MIRVVLNELWAQMRFPELLRWPKRPPILQEQLQYRHSAVK